VLEVSALVPISLSRLAALGGVASHGLGKNAPLQENRHRVGGNFPGSHRDVFLPRVSDRGGGQTQNL
ncbi:MAG: hypothetical protein ACXACI_19170, partial [Candidatus Hodarchaeales archaeon]